MLPLFRASEGVLAQRMTTLATTVLLLQQMAIMPSMGVCRTCDIEITSKYKRQGTWMYWECPSCEGSAGKTGLRANTVLANSNIKLERFVILMWHFADRGKTYNQIMNAACLPSDAEYVENLMSRSTVAKWNQFFRYITYQDYLRNKTQLGGVNCIIEIDETMCGKCKFNKGDRRKRRRCWVFGGICRNTSMAFMSICPQNKRTKAALWPIIQANIAPGSTIYSDGWRAYRRLPDLGYVHRWIDHSKYYVHPEDRSLHTNKCEGLWGNWKRWLPSSGPYNLEEYMNTYLWFMQKKINKQCPFWSLVQLVKENNNIEVLKRALGTEADTEGFVYDDEEAELDSAEVAKLDDLDQYSEEETDDDSAEQEDFSCPFCEKTFPDKLGLKTHVDICMDADDCSLEAVNFNCPYCQEDFSTQEEVMEHMENH